MLEEIQPNMLLNQVHMRPFYIYLRRLRYVFFLYYIFYCRIKIKFNIKSTYKKFCKVHRMHIFRQIQIEVSGMYFIYGISVKILKTGYLHVLTVRDSPLLSLIQWKFIQNQCSKQGQCHTCILCLVKHVLGKSD